MGRRRTSRAPLPARASAGSLLLVAAFALGSCGGGTRTVVQQGPPATTPASVPAASSAAGGAATATTAAGEAPTKVVRLSAFQSPSGNIGCAIAGGVARCDIVQRDWHPPARPPSCPEVVDFGQGVEVEPGHMGRLVCAGDTARDPASAKLAYGTAAETEGLTCVSRRTGISCAGAGRHGFELSRQGYRVF